MGLFMEWMCTRGSYKTKNVILESFDSNTHGGNAEKATCAYAQRDDNISSTARENNVVIGIPGGSPSSEGHFGVSL